MRMHLTNVGVLSPDEGGTHFQKDIKFTELGRTEVATQHSYVTSEELMAYMETRQAMLIHLQTVCAGLLSLADGAVHVSRWTQHRTEDMPHVHACVMPCACWRGVWVQT